MEYSRCWLGRISSTKGADARMPFNQTRFSTIRCQTSPGAFFKVNMIARGFLSFIFLSLAVVAQSQALEVGDAVTPLAEAVIEVDTEGVEWVINEADDEPAPIERRSGAGGRCRRLEVRKEW